MEFWNIETELRQFSETPFHKLMKKLLTKYYFKIFFFLAVLLFTGCQQRVLQIKPELHQDGKYDSEYPTTPCSEELSSIAATIRLLSSVTFYESFEFSKISGITLKDLKNGIEEKKYVNSFIYNRPSTGTATAIYYHHRTIALLTCAHIVDFPDTLITFYKSKSGLNLETVQNFSVKVGQKINVIDLTQGNDFKIIASDKQKDVAVIGKTFERVPEFPIPVFNFPRGSASELNWGNFVYVFGYPKGEKMISTAIVSRPDKDSNHSFLIDASFNRGFSGGIVLAIRDGTPNFELVGLIKAVSAETKYYLAPDSRTKLTERELQNLYNGQMSIKAHENIFYGITYVISIDSINEFINDNRTQFEIKGFNTNLFFPGD